MSLIKSLFSSYFLPPLILLVLVFTAYGKDPGPTSSPDALGQGFAKPAHEYGPRTWWHWLNENIST
ncbi:MAG: hypothetical protein RL328_2608, partial [Acidobacteriota bacterium]